MHFDLVCIFTLLILDTDGLVVAGR